ncbi:hypothetical protein HDV05_007032 [Chytridiales sp. JEL 0842]|nr:hypothetical protein HDV05_007032 [Chytridiales sp. JEL 0842]
MKCIGYKILIGFPKNVRVLYVEQLEEVDTETSVLDIVKDANKSEREWDEWYRISIKRSGARGWQARIKLLEVESLLAKAKSTLDDAISSEEIEKAPFAMQEYLDDILTELEAAAEAKARKILKGLGFSKDWQDGPLSALSGGWRIRVSLAQALFMEPDILLLDEPTNHLDLPAILWLQSYLKSLDGVTLLIVSHDRAFLNELVEEIIVMKDHSLSYHVGNYDTYIQNKEEKLKRDTKWQDALDRKRAHIEKSIQEGIKHAKRTGDDKKFGMVASRQKKLESRFGLERSEKGHRYKGLYFTGNRATITFDKEETTPNWTLPDPEPLRNKGSLLEADNVSFKYADSDKLILQNVTLNVQMGDRIGIVGANGEGKTTLANLLAKQLTPTSGEIRHHPSCNLAYIPQHLITSFDPSLSSLELMKKTYPDAEEKEIRSHLGGFGIGGLATQPIRTLSGGQRVRVAVALETWGGKHLLILDEPTNHLDMVTIESMQESFKGYQGATIVISHDQHFLKEFAKDIYLVQNGQCIRLEGGVDEYVKRILS